MKKGFTIIELIVVLVILAIIALIVTPLLLKIVNNINIPTDYQSSDCSEQQDESVMCWWKENNDNLGYYDMYIGAFGVNHLDNVNLTNIFS